MDAFAKIAVLRSCDQEKTYIYGMFLLVVQPVQWQEECITWMFCILFHFIKWYPCFTLVIFREQ